MRRFIIMTVMLLAGMAMADAQTGAWSGQIEASGMKLSIVFHLDDDKPTVDSPDQGVKGIQQRFRGELLERSL